MQGERYTRAALIFIAFLAPLLFAQAQVVNPNLPGLSGQAGPAEVIRDFYNFSLMIGGLLAFLMILYAAVRYAASRGNPSIQSDAKDAITQALLGLLLLMGAFLILNTVNPELTYLRLPPIVGLTVPPPPPITAPSGLGCGTGGCEQIQGFSCKDGCTAAPQMVQVLNCMAASGGFSGWRVTEAMPPSSPHESSCHNNGCCVDMALTSGSTNDCAKVNAAVSAARSCGASPLNEYTECNGRATHYQTGAHLHIIGC